MTARPRRVHNAGGIMAATWLIGIGLVFLLQRILDIPWGQAWPMFIIVVGVASLISLLIGLGYRRRWFASLAWPLFLIVAGVLLLLSTTGNLGVGPADLVSRWWPVAVIGLGAWLLVAALIPGQRVAGGERDSSGADRVELPLDGAGDAHVKLRFGAGELYVVTARPGLLVDGTFDQMPAKVDLRGPGDVVVEPTDAPDWPWWDRAPVWRVGLPGDVPLELEVESGAAKTRLDLGELRLRSLRIKTGASDTRVVLPRSAGETRVRAEGGAASLTFEVPDGVAARIRSQMAIGSTRVDETRFPRAGSGWETPGYDAAPNRVELDVTGGVGSVQFVGGG